MKDASDTRLAGAKIRKRRTSGAFQTPNKEENSDKSLDESRPTSLRNELKCPIKSCSSRDTPQDGSEPNLKDRCEGEGSPSYLKDIPVFSKTTGIGYANIFCASCHTDTDIHKYEMSVSCFGKLNDTSDIENMIYHSGELRWSLSDDASEDTGVCLLDVAYPPFIGRWCPSGLVDTCQKNWTTEENVRRCSVYNYYVQSGDTIYKNRHCALCNGVPHDKIWCLSLLRFGNTPSFNVPPSLLELFEVRGDCKDDEVWDVLNRRCEHVACGFLFTLQDGKCERSSNTVPEDGQSYLNSSCYVVEYSQKVSTAFPNQSIYLNETQRLYHFGEYEFNGSLIKVCDEKERWTPFMHILSSVLILISLVCLLAHMAIFLLLPERRNIPSMNLFSMTVSLFMAEFMFLTFFQLKFSHVTCIVSGVLMYYFLSVSFLWMNVMSIDIFRTFYYTSSYRTKSRKIFTQYSLYAWILPIGGVTLALLVDEMWPDLVIAPHFGTDTCWLNNKWGQVAFFTLPSGMVILANLVLYMVSVRNIYTQIKSGEMASSTIRKSDGSSKYSGGNLRISIDSSGRRVNRASSEKSSHGSESPNCKERIRSRFTNGFLRKHRGRLILYCKLALIMGMTWIFAFISIHTKNIVFEYLFIIFNGLQGAFIFVAFDLKKKVWEDLLTKTRCCKRRGDYSVGNNSGKVTGSSDGGYKSRPYMQRFNGWRKHSASLGASRSQPSHSTAEIEV
ncbi:putative G-protein coupled receptor Mth-like 10 [Portunus trituberculatus]|uniref:Putative G-protein coupled receptor Mth-like 10 n=1 Tax=Portunus trituberculatus TaxID=210409 RepID=A0A5B7CPE5_PORTR|nr:putative G-protein coupled receptor Mth-like 10 [Portunus trituberculatus]